ncbi:Na+-transporting NADH:ubiquinone oxidoreductase subunit C [Tissierella praeacuta DSM 18095]|uniref:Ion-translocating oxidoreductase complex subunit G n=1 Tax=Tissierella praeacuta DSM 18095 TaxID=1123404 RepID=A0A1M4S4L4_9FIRM|nr:FMN-binding protein [Tissierella praeacuta]TCU71565.1 Na+-transporting NADH:ubiquinone oxidoreductase subunit C [Tissierella praeacuta]SHE27141.1 Na+-transporting NADH:ubiquinone oxidoreductase subunit C [Tissierella praeacuta DSM 18095]SUP00812.1 Na(+)-translocating NADH-quinone reductase subunit C [Tissierella praeacuta]
MKKSFSFPIVFMVILTAFFTFILAFLNYSTADRIAFNQEIELSKKLLYIFDIQPLSENPNDINQAFMDNIDNIGSEDEPMYIYYGENKEVLGYAVPISGSGLWGSIEGYVGVSSDYSTILGLDFTSHSETPGLGGRISEDWYKEQFRGIDITESQNGNYIIYRPSAGGNIDAIAGATLTSKSVSKLLNEDLDKFIKERKGE